MNKSQWWSEIEDIINVHSLLRHPFYQAWQSGKLSIDDLKYYAAQYYPHVEAFPRYVSAVHSNAPDRPTREMLVENLVEEERGEENHPELWLRFAEGLGLNRDEVLGASIQPETKECVKEFMTLARSENVLEGLAALYAYESQIPGVSSTKIQGLKEFYGVTDQRSRKFFEVHEKADAWHSQVERETLQRLASTPEAREAVKRSVETACKAVWKLLDGVVKNREICCH